MPRASSRKSFPRTSFSSTRTARPPPLASLPPASVRLTKQLMKRQLAAPIAAQMQEEGRIFAEQLKSGEAQEGDDRVLREAQA